MSPIGAGSVNTTWKYGTGSRSASRAASQSFAAAPWHFRAVTVAARVVRDLGVCALLAARDMSAERRGAAALDCRHHLQLAEADMAGIGPAPCRAVVAEDIRNVQRWTRHEEPRGRRAARPSRPYGRYAPAGSRLPESSWWRRVYRAPWYRAWRARGGPGSTCSRWFSQ